MFYTGKPSNAKTIWIGGSYSAACGGTPPPPELSVLLLQAINDKPGITTSDLAIKLDKSYNTVMHTLTRMQNNGLVHSDKFRVRAKVGSVFKRHWFSGSKPDAKK